jgi:hypothetical protein
MPEPSTSAVLATAFVAGCAGELGRATAARILETLDAETEKGWQRDKEAGGISSGGIKNKPQANPA